LSFAGKNKIATIGHELIMSCMQQKLAKEKRKIKLHGIACCRYWWRWRKKLRPQLLALRERDGGLWCFLG